MKNFLALLFFVMGCSVTPIPSPPSVTLSNLSSSAGTSECAAHSFTSRGKAPKAFMEGMALSYAKEICKPTRLTAQAAIGPKDILGHYAAELQKVGLGSGTEALRLKSVYAVLIGLGMRESSGKHCEGRDKSASNVEASTAEAGLFQASQNSSNFSSELKAMLIAPRHCLLEVFSVGVTCKPSDAINHGTGPGVEFQKQMKGCPSLAVQYTGALLRLSGGAESHFGPIRRKEAEVVPACVQMLTAVEDMIKTEPKLCEAFL
jgi:hypothetical protein